MRRTKQALISLADFIRFFHTIHMLCYCCDANIAPQDKKRARFAAILFNGLFSGSLRISYFEFWIGLMQADRKSTSQ